MLVIRHNKFAHPLQVYSNVVIIINYIVCYLHSIENYKFLISIASRPKFLLHQYPNIGGGAKSHFSPPFDIGVGLKSTCPSVHTPMTRYREF